MKKLILSMLVLTGCPIMGSAADTSAVTFLRLPAGARSVAMGEAFSAAADDATALYWNPALLALTNGNSAALMHASYLSDTSYDFGAVNFRTGKSGFAIGVQRFSSGNMTEYDYTGTQVGGFSPSDMAIILGYGLQFGDGYAVGVAPKYIRSSIISSAETYAVDAGFATPYYNDKIRLAAVASNFGRKIRYDSADEDLPLIVRMGAACKLSQKVLLTAEGGFPRAGNKYFASGLEYKEKVESINFAGRLGYNSRTAGDVPGFNGLSTGIGIGFARLSVDYALTFFGELGTAHRFSLSFKFG